MEPASRVTPLIVTQKPSKTSLRHQDSVDEASDDEWEDPPSSPSLHPPTTQLSTATLPSVPQQVKKKKKRSFLFHRKKKRGSTDVSGQRPVSPERSDSGSSLRELGDVLTNPSLIHRNTDSRDCLSPLPSTLFTRSMSDPAVHRAGVETEGKREPQRWLVHITLESGHGLAIRDRTGTSDPYVKFKYGQFKYRSTVVNRNLNPEWNEAFSFVTRELHLPLQVKVYDHDYGSLDDYMGGGTISLQAYSHGVLHIVDIGLQDPQAKEHSLGYIRLFLSITPYEEEQGPHEAPIPHSIQQWNSILTIHLLKASNLPAMDDNGFSDPYCKFKLGRQKRRSTVVTRCLNPDWKEQFDLRMYEGDNTTLHVEVWDRDLLQSDDFIGETCVELGTLTQEQTHDLTLPLSGDHPGNYGTIHLLLTITGTAAHEVMEGDTVTTNNVSWRTTSAAEMRAKYVLWRSLSPSLLNDIGHVTVIIDRVEGLGRTADVFAIAEVGNSQARTHTVYKTTTPYWGKAFHFNVKDIHAVLEVSVYSASKSKPELIGRIKIPLLRLEEGINKGYVLKDKQCLDPVKGVLYLKCSLVYQPVRAALRTLKPRECKLMEREAPFQRKVLMHNIKRIMSLVNDLSAIMASIRHIYNWENKLHSTLALLGFIVSCLVFEVWMVPLVLMMVFLVQYGLVYGRGRHQWQLQAKKQASTTSSELSLDQAPVEVIEEWSELEDDLEEVSGDRGRKKSSFRRKFRQLQAILLIVQNVLGEIADTGERINNLMGWKVPFLCWLCILILSIATIITILIPLRFLVLAWGVNKLTKKLRKPHYIPNNELQDLISCSPSNRDLREYRELPVTYRRPSRAPTPYQGHHPSHSHSPQPRPHTQSNPQVKHPSFSQNT